MVVRVNGTQALKQHQSAIAMHGRHCQSARMVDAITEPLTFAKIFANLGQKEKRALRAAGSKEVQQLVDERVSRVEIDLMATPPEETLEIAERTRVRPSSLLLRSMGNEERGRAYGPPHHRAAGHQAACAVQQGAGAGADRRGFHRQWQLAAGRALSHKDF